MLLMLNQDNVLTLIPSRLLLRCSSSALCGDYSLSDADKPASAASVVSLLWTTQRELDSMYIWTLQKKLHALFPCVFFLFVTNWESSPPSPAANVAHETLWHCSGSYLCILIINPCFYFLSLYYCILHPTSQPQA